MPGQMLRVGFFLHPLVEVNTREVYNAVDVIGNLGGVIEMIFVSVGILISPISKHSFITNAIKKLFLANTTDNSLFKKEQSSKYKQTNQAPDIVQKQVENHKVIRIRTIDSTFLFISNRCLIFNRCWKKK